MSKCDYCGTTIIFGGTRDGGLRYCSSRCQQSGMLSRVTLAVPDAELQRELWSVHQGPCPKCGGSGPIDVHVSHRVWSALVVTSWASRPQLSCRSCGIKSKLGDTAFSAVLGWWGLPWGLVMTPVQVGRNLFGLMRSSDSTRPSQQLEKLVRMQLVAKAAVEQVKQQDA